MHHHLPLNNGKVFRMGRIVAFETLPISHRVLLAGFAYLIWGKYLTVAVALFPPAKRVRLTFPLENQLVETIHHFVRAVFSLPLKRRHYNDDIRLEPYRPALPRFAGGQRKGIHDPLD